MKKLKNHVIFLLKWMLLGVLIGCIGGLLGAGFHHVLHFVTHLRGQNPWLICLLAVGGLGTVGLYRLFRLPGNRGTNEIIESALTGGPVKTQVAPAIFLAMGCKRYNPNGIGI